MLTDRTLSPVCLHALSIEDLVMRCARGAWPTPVQVLLNSAVELLAGQPCSERDRRLNDGIRPSAPSLDSDRRLGLDASTGLGHIGIPPIRSII